MPKLKIKNNWTGAGDGVVLFCVQYDKNWNQVNQDWLNDFRRNMPNISALCKAKLVIKSLKI